MGWLVKKKPEIKVKINDENLPEKLVSLKKKHPWHMMRNLTKFRGYYNAAAMACYNGFPTQMNGYMELCRNVVDKDREDLTITVGRDLGFPWIKHFATADPNSRLIIVQDRKHDWRIDPVEKHKGLIPHQHLKTLTALRQRGIEFDGYGIASPVPKPSRKPVLDPILLGRVGSRWVEIGRWL